LQSSRRTSKKPSNPRFATGRRSQELHYTSNRHAVLVILQATEAAGKDGAVRHMMSGVNPQGCRDAGEKTCDAEAARHRGKRFHLLS
jgi:polyphosphate kinase 2 (PPK2 family)